MEHKVIQNLRAVSGDKALFKQGHRKFTTVIGQVRSSYEEIVRGHRVPLGQGSRPRQRDGEDRDRTGADHGEEFEKTSGDAWNILIDKAEMEANDKIKMVPKGQGVVAYGVMYRWFTDAFGLGLAERSKAGG
jgi:hypothetical protein